MIEQRVENRRLNSWRGAAVVLASMLVVVLASSLFGWLERWIGRAASILFIAFGFGVACFLMNRYVLAYIYTYDGACLRVYRAYGRLRRPMLELWTGNVRAAGSPEPIKKRFPGARMQRATRPGCPNEALALAHNDAGRTAILLIQPNDQLRAALSRK